MCDNMYTSIGQLAVSTEQDMRAGTGRNVLSVSAVVRQSVCASKHCGMLEKQILFVSMWAALLATRAFEDAQTTLLDPKHFGSHAPLSLYNICNGLIKFCATGASTSPSSWRL